MSLDNEKIIQQLTPIEKKKYYKSKRNLAAERVRKLVNKDFLEFVKYMWPEFIEGRHHRFMADMFNDIANDKVDRLIINMPPRHTKSEFASYFLPAWMVAKNPKLKIIQTTHTADLAIDFGRKVKHLLDDPLYSELFATRLMEDSQAAGKWKTEQGGEYFAAGVGGAITGRGADLLIIDDPHKEQDIKKDGKSFDKAWDWYLSGPRQRLQPGGKIIVVMTRWSTKDITGQLLKSMSADDADKWKVIKFPAILPSGKPCWPEFWKLKELQRTQATLTGARWNAQYMQEPTSEEGALIKRDWWQDWPHQRPPKVEFIIQSYDTAFTKQTTSDYSAITTWGVFNKEGDGQHAILLAAEKNRMDFPDLRRRAHELYLEWRPDQVIVEAKASGLPLIHELRNMDIPVINFTPSRGNDKISRVNAVAPLFESGRVWAPFHQTFAQEVIEECAAFPNGDYDDYVDSTTQAISRLRGGYFLTHPEDKVQEPITREIIEYYG
tara:strand:- start:1224 stop:2702 length:1479 start_codon:yes stop_codon:yes gene_type:complete